MDKRDPFALSRLPEELAPPDLWEDIEARLDARPRRTWPWGLAACLLLVVVAGQVWQAGDRPIQVQPMDLLALQQQRSAELEDSLELVLDGPVGLAVLAEAGALEHELALIDEALAWEPGETRLWSERVRVLEALVGLYATEIWLAQADLARL
ncbi:MAG: hypothetical protein EA418_00895 [Wenzhouxiangellaceae bacterium]|nr:MAG: hypothetical protein EA418_00895 [Wenzhouxiangellaceae bacterium]